MCIVLYMKLISCNGFQRSILDWGSMCQIWIYYIWNLFSVMVFQRTMLDWGREVHLPSMNSLQNLLYKKLILCNGFPQRYAQLDEGVGSICYWYMCIVLYMKLIWCNGFPEIYAQLEEGWGQSAIGICAFCYIYMKLIWCNGFPKIYAPLEEGVGSICHG